MEKIIHITLNIVIPMVLFMQPALGQQQQKVNADNVQKSILLDEVKAILADEDNGITVKAILGNNNGGELKRGDVIFMAQGLPVSSVSDLISLYEKTGKKQEFRMAVKRNGDRFLTSFDIDPDSETGREMFTGTMKFNSSDANTSGSMGTNLVPELLVYGIMSAGSDNGLIIKKTMPNLDSNLKEKGINDGDKIISVAGKKVKTHKDFKKVWDEISEGEKVELKIAKGDKEVSVLLSKKDVNGKIIFNKEG